MGAQRWIDLGFMRLQPSELMKIAMVMLLAAYYDWLPLRKTSHPLWVLLPVLMVLPPTGLVLTQPDLGTAILLVTAGALMMFLAGVHWAYFGSVAGDGRGGVWTVFQSRGNRLAAARGLPVPPHRYLPRSRDRSAGGGLSHHAGQDRHGIGRLDRARVSCRARSRG